MSKSLSSKGKYWLLLFMLLVQKKEMLEKSLLLPKLQESSRFIQQLLPVAVGPLVYVHSQRSQASLQVSLPAMWTCIQNIFQYIRRTVDVPLNKLFHCILSMLARRLSSFVSVLWNKYLYLNTTVLPYILKQVSKFKHAYIYLRHQMYLGWWVGKAHLPKSECSTFVVVEEKKTASRDMGITSILRYC